MHQKPEHGKSTSVPQRNCLIHTESYVHSFVLIPCTPSPTSYLTSRSWFLCCWSNERIFPSALSIRHDLNFVNAQGSNRGGRLEAFFHCSSETLNSGGWLREVNQKGESLNPREMMLVCAHVHRCAHWHVDEAETDKCLCGVSPNRENKEQTSWTLVLLKNRYLWIIRWGSYACIGCNPTILQVKTSPSSALSSLSLSSASEF